MIIHEVTLPVRNRALALAYDSSSNIYVAGIFDSTTDLDPGPKELFVEGPSVFLLKFNPDGELLWADTWNIWGYKLHLTLVIDKDDNIYLAGGFQNTIDFDPGPEINEHTSIEGLDGVLCKLNSEGGLEWVRTWASASSNFFLDEAVHHLDVFNSGNIVVIGNFTENVNFNEGLYQLEAITTGGDNSYICIFGNDGTMIDARTIHATESMFPSNAIIDSNDSIYIIFWFTGDMLFDSNSSQLMESSNEPGTYAICKFNSSLDLEWVKLMPLNNGTAIAIDNSNNLLIAGTFSDDCKFDRYAGAEFIAGTPFLAAIDSDSNLVWETQFDMELDEINYYYQDQEQTYLRNIFEFRNIAVTSNNQIIISGELYPEGSECEGFMQDLFISQYSINGELNWLYTYGSSTFEVFKDMVINNNGSLVLCGFYRGEMHLGWENDGQQLEAVNDSENAFLISIQLNE